MDPRRKDKIRSEMKKAEEFLEAAELLHKNALYSPSVVSAYQSAFHASIAAMLTSGTPQKEPFVSFLSTLNKFSVKLDPFVVKLKGEQGEWSANTGIDYSDNEALLRIYQTREFFLEVKDFLRRIIK